jgi:hypothetical protein
MDDDQPAKKKLNRKSVPLFRSSFFCRCGGRQAGGKRDSAFIQSCGIFLRFGQTECGGIVLAVICWAPSAKRRCYPTGRCIYRPQVTCSLSINFSPPLGGPASSPLLQEADKVTKRQDTRHTTHDTRHTTHDTRHTTPTVYTPSSQTPPLPRRSLISPPVGPLNDTK